ncbi:MAG: hypothetical protein AB1512_14835 [Thermodesulfobacteriota bacterium]
MEGIPGCQELATRKAGLPCSLHQAHIEYDYNDQQDTLVMRVWHKGPSYLAVVAEEGIEPAPGLKTGQRVRVRYYVDHRSSACQSLDTVVRKVSLKSGGQLDGCYLVEMEILN